MRDGDRKGPQPQLRRWYPCERPWMASAGKPEDAEGDDKQAGTELDLALPFNNGDEQCKRKDHQQHRKQMAGRERPKR